MSNRNRSAICPLSLGTIPVIRHNEVFTLEAAPQRPVSIRRLVVSCLPAWEDVDPDLWSVISDATIERDEWRKGDVPSGLTELERAEYRAFVSKSYNDADRKVRRLMEQMPARQAITPDGVVERIDVGVNAQLMQGSAIHLSVFSVTALDNSLAAMVAQPGMRVGVTIRSRAMRPFELSAVMFCNALS